MSDEIDPKLKARIIMGRQLAPVDKLRRYSKALSAVFDAIDPLPIQERVDLLEEILNVLDPENQVDGDVP